MKHELLLLVAISTIWLSCSRKGYEEFNAAESLYEKSLYQESIAKYDEVRKKYKNRRPLVAKSTYNIGQIHFENENYEQAKKEFYNLLLSTNSELDRGGVGSGIMQDPYALYKHNACKNLAEIYLQEENYEEALKYTQLFDLKYPYQHFCGNELMYNEIFTAHTYARCYEGLEMEDEAIKVLIPYLFPTGLASNNELSKMAERLLKQNYTKNELEQELSIMHKGLRSVNMDRGKNQYVAYVTTFLDVEVLLPDVWSLSLIMNEEENEEIDIYREYLEGIEFFSDILK